MDKIRDYVRALEAGTIDVRDKDDEDGCDLFERLPGSFNNKNLRPKRPKRLNVKTVDDFDDINRQISKTLAFDV